MVQADNYYSFIVINITIFDFSTLPCYISYQQPFDHDQPLTATTV